MIAVEGEGTKYWPRWRGPSGQGSVAGSGYPDAWSATENVAWKTPIPGSGNSSPIVWGDRIFLTTAYDNGAKLSVVALQTGRWRARVGGVCAVAARGARIRRTAMRRRRPRLTAHESTRRSGTLLVAFDMSGKPVWNQDLGPISNYHGPAGSPLLYKDRLIVYQDQSSGSFIAAFDAADRQAPVAHQPRRDGRLGHAGCCPRRRSR